MVTVWSVWSNCYAATLSLSFNAIAFQYRPEKASPAERGLDSRGTGKMGPLPDQRRHRRLPRQFQVSADACRDWRRMNVAARFKSRDQGNLIALLLRKYLGQWAYVGATSAGACSAMTRRWCIFTGPGHLGMAPLMSKFCGLTRCTHSPARRCSISLSGRRTSHRWAQFW